MNNKIKEQYERDRRAAGLGVQHMLVETLRMCQDKMTYEHWDITDFFPVVNRERVLVGRKVYELTAHMIIEEIDE